MTRPRRQRFILLPGWNPCTYCQKNRRTRSNGPARICRICYYRPNRRRQWLRDGWTAACIVSELFGIDPSMMTRRPPTQP